MAVADDSTANVPISGAASCARAHTLRFNPCRLSSCQHISGSPMKYESFVMKLPHHAPHHVPQHFCTPVLCRYRQRGIKFLHELQKLLNDNRILD